MLDGFSRDQAVFMKERLADLEKRREQLEAGLEEVAQLACNIEHDAVDRTVVAEASPRSRTTSRPQAKDPHAARAAEGRGFR